jgi:radical SAM protein with 4Fe4S-binding SPASM domain
MGKDNKNKAIVHLPKESGIKKGAEEFPFMVVVSVTYVCNAKCPNCPYTRSNIRQTYKDRPFITSETFKKIADECGPYQSYIRITGGGEPMLHPQIVELIEYAKKVGARIGLITNGSVLTPDKVDRLLAVNTDAIEISADAADKETYSKVRVGLNFDTLVRNVRYLVKKRNELKSDTRIVASVINQKAVADRLESTVAFWKGIVDEVQVRKYLTWGIGDPEQSADPTPYIPDLPVRVPCPFPFERLNIDSRGKIEFCGYDIAGETNFGNVNEVSIKSVWQGKKFNEWRELLLQGKFEEISICRKCPDWRYRSWNYNYWNVMKKAERKKAEKLHIAEKDVGGAVTLLGDE